VFDLLTELANGLGVAVEYLWTTMVRQQYADGIIYVVMAVVCLIAMVLVVQLTPRLRKFAYERYKSLYEARTKNSLWSVSTTEEDNWEFIYSAVPVVAICVGILLCILIPVFATMGIRRIINPDYFAIQEILYTISAR
jgi:hypothetical protein